MNRRDFAAVGFAVTACGTAQAQASSAPVPAAPMTAADAAKAFGAREYVQDASLAPDGSAVAIVVPDAGRGAYLQIADFASGKPPRTVLKTSGSPDRLAGCRWVNTGRLVCTIYFIDTSRQVPLGYSRLVAINADGSDLKMLSDRTNDRSLGTSTFGGEVIDWTGDGSNDGTVMMTRNAVPERAIGTNLASSAEGLGVDLVDTTRLTHRIVESPKRLIAGYMTDGVGNVRLIGALAAGSNGYIGRTISWSYRKQGEQASEGLGVYRLGVEAGRGFDPQAVDPAMNAAYALDDEGGHRVLVRIALDGSRRREVIVANPIFDIDDVIRIGRRQRVVGASWAGEKREVAFFDPELKALSVSFARALPRQPQVRFVDATADEKQLLMFAGGDDHAGTYYLYDKASRKLEEVMPARPQLAAARLSKVTPISFKAADGTSVPGYLTLPPGGATRNLPAIVMPHGGPGARDEWGFDWLVQFFANRGFAVLQPNFRGSSGYGEGWFERNGFQSWRSAIGDVDDGARWLVSQGIADPTKLAIVGWSYGGYAALQGAVTDPDLYKAVIAIAPVTDLDQLRNESRWFSNFPLVDRYIGSGPHVAEGSPARHADRIKAPVLMFHGNLDLNVKINQSRLMAGRLRGAGKTVELVEYDKLDHQLDDSAIRAEMLAKSDAFLRASLGM